MKKKKKKEQKEITIHSDETKIIIGVLFAILGIGITIAPFFDAQLFRYATHTAGFAAIPFGISIIYFSMRFFTTNSKLTSIKIQLGLILFSIAFATFLTFWIPDEQLVSTYDYSSSAGLIGYYLHLNLVVFMGKLLEMLLILTLFIVSTSFITDVKLAQIKDFLAGIFSTRSGEDNEENQLESRLKFSDDNNEINIKGNLGKQKEEEFEETLEEKKIEEPIKMKTYHQTSISSETETHEDTSPKYENWVLPSIELLQEPVVVQQDEKVYKRNALVIKQTLKSFGIEGTVAEISVGPTVVQYALSINVGTRVSKVNNLADDLALALSVASSSIRVETPIPGTSYIGIETPNPIKNYVYAKDMVNQLKKNDNYMLPLILGKDVAGKYMFADLVKMPHLLVAGATGTGKSVGINSILLGLLMTKTPDEVRFILVDPKMVEFAPYNGIPHLLNPVITDMDLVINALQWALDEMHRRYLLLKQVGVRNIKEYNSMMGYNAMQYIVIVIDEMADLMLQKGVDVETKIVRLAQMSRAVGIHLILATQRPSVNVITGIIKANIPARMAFSVATAIDSRVIIDQVGAESLLGNGDMLFKDPSMPKPTRIQGAFTDIKDLDKVIKHIKSQAGDVQYSNEITETKAEDKSDSGSVDSDDPVFRQALQVVINAQKASTSFLQRKLKIGYNRAARMIDEMEEIGAISGPEGGSMTRRVLISSPDQVLGGNSEKEE